MRTKKMQSMIQKNRKMGNTNSAPKEEVDKGVKLPVDGINMDIVPADYRYSEVFREFVVNQEAIFEDFIEKSTTDEYNSSYADALIEARILECIEDIIKQRKNHMRLITDGIYLMHEGDVIKAKAKLELFEKDLTQCEKDINDYHRIIYEGTSLERKEED